MHAMAFKSQQARKQVITAVGHKPVMVYRLIYVQKLKSGKPGGCLFLSFFLVHPGLAVLLTSSSLVAHRAGKAC